jgi:hypothetical protein
MRVIPFVIIGYPKWHVGLSRHYHEWSKSAKKKQKLAKHYVAFHGKFQSARPLKQYTVG